MISYDIISYDMISYHMIWYLTSELTSDWRGLTWSDVCMKSGLTSVWRGLTSVSYHMIWYHKIMIWYDIIGFLTNQMAPKFGWLKKFPPPITRRTALGQTLTFIFPSRTRPPSPTAQHDVFFQPVIQIHWHGAAQPVRGPAPLWDRQGHLRPVRWPASHQPVKPGQDQEEAKAERYPTSQKG